jgi:WD40 repeat protein
MLHNLRGHNAYIYSTKFSSDGKYIFTTSKDNTAKIWDVASGKIIHDFGGNPTGLSAQFSPDGKYFVKYSHETASIWEVASGKMLHHLTGHKNIITSTQFSPDGRYIVTTSTDFTAKIWYSANGKMLHNLRGHKGFILSAQFSTDGNYIVTVSVDKTAKIWELSSGKMLKTMRGHNMQTTVRGNKYWGGSAEFSPDGKYVVSVSVDKTAKIWEVATGKMLYDLNVLPGWDGEPQFSPDGKSILTITDDHKTILWDVATGKMRYTRIQLSNNDWLVYDEHYRYDGSAGAIIDHLCFVCGIEIINLAQMKDALYVPGLAGKIIHGEDINYPRLSELDICKKQNPGR